MVCYDFKSYLRGEVQKKFQAPIVVELKVKDKWSEMTLNYWVMVEGYPNLKEEVRGSNPGYEISSLLDGKLAKWSTASCAWRWPVGLRSQKKKQKNKALVYCKKGILTLTSAKLYLASFVSS